MDEFKNHIKGKEMSGKNAGDYFDHFSQKMYIYYTYKPGMEAQFLQMGVYKPRIVDVLAMKQNISAEGSANNLI